MALLNRNTFLTNAEGVLNIKQLQDLLYWATFLKIQETSHPLRQCKCDWNNMLKFRSPRKRKKNKYKEHCLFVYIWSWHMHIYQILTENFFQLLSGNCSKYLHLKNKSAYSCVVNTKHTKWNFLSTEGYIEKAALLFRHITVIKVTVLQISHSSFFFSKSTGILCFHPVAEEPLQSQCLLFHRIGN